MPKNEKIISPQLLAHIKKLAPAQAIFGGPEDSAKRLPCLAEQPDNLKKYSHGRFPMSKMFYCNSGDAVLTLDGTSYHLEAGDVFFIRRNAVCNEAFLQIDKPYVVTWFIPRAWGTMGMHQAHYHKDGVFRLTHQQNVRLTLNLVKQLDRVILLGMTGKREMWQKIKSNIISLFAHLQKLKVEFYRPIANQWQAKIVHELYDYLKEHFHEDILLPEAVKRTCSYSPAYMDTLFRQEYGDGIMHSVIKLRLDKASHLLEKSKLNITEVARQCGYEDNCYFSRLFKKVYSISPREYRHKFA